MHRKLAKNFIKLNVDMCVESFKKNSKTVLLFTQNHKHVCQDWRCSSLRLIDVASVTS